MKNRIKLCLQVAWVTAVFVVLAMSFNFCAATDHACFDAVDRMFLMMVVLSFPAGIFGLGVASFFLWPLLSVDQLYDHSIFWLAMAGAGYLQWFVILPRVFTKRKFTTLNLRETKTGLGETKTDFEEPKKVVQVTPREVPRLRRTQRRIRRIRAYDKLGRTPLERALRSRSTNASA